MAWLRALSPITLWGSSQSVGRLEWGLYFELITGIYAVIHGLVISSKQLDKQTGYDTACSAWENCCLQKADLGKCLEIAFFISHLMSVYTTRKPKPDYWRCDTLKCAALYRAQRCHWEKIICAHKLLNSCFRFNIVFGVRQMLLSSISCSLATQTKPQSHFLLKQ